jgi:hypothetical protein
MKEVTGILKASIPVIIGVAIGMLAYEQIKKFTTKA